MRRSCRSLAELTDEPGELFERIGFWNEERAMGHLRNRGTPPPGRYDDLDIRVLARHLLRQLEPVHGAMNVYVREHHLDLGMRVQNSQSIRAGIGLEGAEAIVLHRLGRTHPEEDFVLHHEDRRWGLNALFHNSETGMARRAFQLFRRRNA